MVMIDQCNNVTNAEMLQIPMDTTGSLSENNGLHLMAYQSYLNYQNQLIYAGYAPQASLSSFKHNNDFSVSTGNLLFH